MTDSPVPAFVAQIRNALETTGLLGKQIIVAVSGGADSVSLLRGILQATKPERLCVAHLDHQLRGADSTADANWVAELSQGLQVEHIGGLRDVYALAEELGIGMEEAARRARYEFLESAAKQFNASAIALAHTASDQAETVLHHILRGTGLSGLGGMQVLRPLTPTVKLFRPMLEIRRDEVLRFLLELGQGYRDDLSNSDPVYTRNRIRHKLLPLLERDFNPHVVDSLLRLSKQAGEAHQALQMTARILLESAFVHEEPGRFLLDAGQLQHQSRHVLREMFVELWRRQEWPRQKMGFDDWNRVVDVALTGTAVTLPGPIEARRKAGRVILRDLRLPY